MSQEAFLSAVLESRSRAGAAEGVEEGSGGGGSSGCSGGDGGGGGGGAVVGGGGGLFFFGGSGGGENIFVGSQHSGADVGVDPLHGRKMLARDRGVKFLRCC